MSSDLEGFDGIAAIIEKTYCLCGVASKSIKRAPTVETEMQKAVITFYR